MTPILPRTSVVIPCYNAARWIGEAVRSVVVQDDILEVIVIDDGSTDESAAVAEGEGGRLLRLIRQTHSGASRARNVGTAAARGAFVQYLDADDVLCPGTVAARLAALDATGADVAYTDWVKWELTSDGLFREGETLRRVLGPRPEVDLLNGSWWPPGALLYRRAIVDRVGPWREDLPIIQDARFHQDAACAGAQFVHVPGVGVRFRRHGTSSLSRRDPDGFLEDCFRNARQFEDDWAQAGALDPERRRALARVFANVARGSFPTNRRRFFEAIRRARSVDPSFVSESPASLRLLSLLVGVTQAEYAAGWWRRGRAMSARSGRESTHA